MWSYLENYDEEIESKLVGESKDFEQKICYELTEACKGVDRSKKEKEELEVNINNEKQTLKSGSEKKDSEPDQFNVNINEEGAAEKLVNQINMAIKDKKPNNDGDDDEGDDDERDDDERDDDDNEVEDEKYRGW